MDADTLKGTPIETGRGRTTVYDTITGESSEALVTMLPQLMRKKRPDGSKVFTEEKPPNTPIRGKLKCELHLDDPNRERYNVLGLPTCPKDNLTSVFHVKRHMKNRHNMEWSVIEQDRKDADEARKAAERIEDREFQRSLMGAKAPLYVSKKDQEKGG